MPVAEITKVLEFDAAHRILGHESRCRFLHGHRYRAEVTVSAEALDGVGRVIDFSVVKREVGGWIDKWWDHNIILHPEDPLVALHDFETQSPRVGDELSVFKGKPPFVMPSGVGNPTVENMVKYLYEAAETLLYPQVRVVHVRLWETPTCYADYPPRSRS